MPQGELNNLVRIGKLKPEPPARAELEGLLRSGSLRLAEETTAARCPENRTPIKDEPRRSGAPESLGELVYVPPVPGLLRG